MVLEDQSDSIRCCMGEALQTNQHVLCTPLCKGNGTSRCMCCIEIVVCVCDARWVEVRVMT